MDSANTFLGSEEQRLAIEEKARAFGFSGAAFMPASGLKIIPEFRMFCEENTCGNYNKLPACPPMSGTVEEMTKCIADYQYAFVLQTALETDDLDSKEVQKQCKYDHNIMTDQLLDELKDSLPETRLLMSCGPWKNHSCLSAYCVSAQHMAESVGMECWVNDNILRFFSVVLF